MDGKNMSTCLNPHIRKTITSIKKLYHRSIQVNHLPNPTTEEMSQALSHLFKNECEAGDIDLLSYSDSTALKVLAIRLTKTPPYHVFRKLSLTQAKITNIAMARLWKAATDMLGQHYPRVARHTQTSITNTFTPTPKTKTATASHKSNTKSQTSTTTKRPGSKSPNRSHDQPPPTAAPTTPLKSILRQGDGPTDKQKRPKGSGVGFEKTDAEYPPLPNTAPPGSESKSPTPPSVQRTPPANNPLATSLVRLTHASRACPTASQSRSSPAGSRN
jgi:hypothetical protein